MRMCLRRHPVPGPALNGLLFDFFLLLSPLLLAWGLTRPTPGKVAPMPRRGSGQGLSPSRCKRELLLAGQGTSEGEKLLLPAVILLIGGIRWVCQLVGE